jgi:hypothetical protein
MTNPKNALSRTIAHEVLNKHFVEIDWLNHYYTEQELYTSSGEKMVQTTPWIVIKFKGYM